jgi:hypothetical protein
MHNFKTGIRMGNWPKPGIGNWPKTGTGNWLELGSRPKTETAPNTHFIHLSVMGKN